MWQADHLFPSVSTSCELRMYPMQVYVLNLCRQNGGNWRCLCMLEKAFVAGFVETAKIARPPSPSVRHAVRQSVFRTFFLDICVTRTVRSVRLFLRGQHSQLRTSGSRQELCVSVGVSCTRDKFRCRQFDMLFLSDPVHNTEHLVRPLWNTVSCLLLV